jgi:alpha-beta hydrolase superfamily lysophospholipase
MAARVTRLSSDERPCALIEPRSITVDGDRIAYRVAGKGPVLLLVHGMAGSSVTWRHVMPALAKRFRVLAPDLLGQGQSAKPRGDYSLGAHANTLRDLMDALGHKRATVVGQSPAGRSGGATRRWRTPRAAARSFAACAT